MFHLTRVRLLSMADSSFVYIGVQKNTNYLLLHGSNSITTLIFSISRPMTGVVVPGVVAVCVAVVSWWFVLCTGDEDNLPSHIDVRVCVCIYIYFYKCA